MQRHILHISHRITYKYRQGTFFMKARTRPKKVDKTSRGIEVVAIFREAEKAKLIFSPRLSSQG